MGFVFEKQNIKDIILIKPDKYQDNRGFFKEVYKKSLFLKNGIKEEFNQDNFSLSNKNVLRGLHFQNKPYSQSKLIYCPKGEIIDVAVDLRKSSPDYKKSFKIKLSEENGYVLYIPKGFAHGFLSLKDETIICYKTDKEYSIEAQNGIIWNDKDLNIDWQINSPILSKKDENLPSLKEIKDFF